MRSIKIPLLCLLSLLALASMSQAQDCPPWTLWDCDTTLPKVGDTVTYLEVTNRPGDTALIPVYITHGDSVNSLVINLSIDTTYLKPIIEELVVDTTEIYDTTGALVEIFYDSNFIYAWTPGPDNRLASDSLAVNLAGDKDTPGIGSNANMRFSVTSFYNLNLWPEAGEVLAFYVNCEVDPGAPDNAVSALGFYDDYLFVVDSTSFPPCTLSNSCSFSQYSAPELDTIQIDIGGGVVIDSVFPSEETRRFAVVGAVHRVDTSTAPPAITSLTANPNSVENAGDSTVLTWTVERADSVRLTDAFALYDVMIPGGSGSYKVAVRPSDPFTITAYNDFGTDTRQITVAIGGVGGNNPPTVSLSPSDVVYNIEQGQTVSIQVTASDVDGDEITLGPASILPPNATFGPTNPVVGTGNAVGNFSFTPDINQSGAFVITFNATDNAATPGTGSASVTINVAEIEFDRLFTVSAEGQSPTGGLAGAEAVYFPINLITSQDVYGVQFDLIYDDSLFTIDSIITTARTDGFVVYDNIGQTPGEVRVTTFGMANETIQTDTTSEILWVVLSIDSTAVPGSYDIILENGWESINPDPNFPSLPLVTNAGIVEVDRPGDVNLDKRIDVADLVNIVGYIIGNYGLTDRQFATANVVIDIDVDVFDLVGVINIIFGVPVQPAPPETFVGGYATMSLDYGDLFAGSYDMMVVRSELPTEIAGAQIEIDYNPNKVDLMAPELTADASQLAMTYKDDDNGKLKVLLHFKNPSNSSQLLQSGAVDLVNIPVEAKSQVVAGDVTTMRLRKALLSTATSAAVEVDGVVNELPRTFVLYQNYPNPFNPTTTIEFAINGSDPRHATLDIFNILGQQVTRLVDEVVQPGIHQVEWNGTSSSGQPVATGIYLYRLEVNAESESKKMLLLK